MHLAERPVAGGGEAGLRHRAAWACPGLLVLEAFGPQLEGGGAVELSLGGAAVPPPVCAFTLHAADSPGLLLVLRTPTGLAPGLPVELRRGGRLLGAFALGPAIGDVAGLLLDRPDPERARLLRTFVSVVASTLRGARDPAVAGPAHAVAAALSKGRVVATPLSNAAAPLTLFDAGAAAAPTGGTWYLLDPTQIRRLSPPEGRLLLIEGPLASGAVLLPPDPAQPMRLAKPARHLPALLDLVRQRRRPKLARALTATLARRAQREAHAASVLRTAQLLSPQPMRMLDDPAVPVGGALELALSDAEGGVFLRGWLRDPLGLAGALTLDGALASQPVPWEIMFRVPRPDLADRLAQSPFGPGAEPPGFVAYLPEVAMATSVAQWALEVRLTSGERIARLVAPPAVMQPAAGRDLVLSAVEPFAVTPKLLGRCLAPAAERLHRAAMARNVTPERRDFGPPSPFRPKAAIVVPLYRNLSFLRAQIGAFGRDPALRATELVYVLDSPEQRAEAETLLDALARLHDLPITLLVQPENRGYAAACNAGAATCSAPVLVMMNSDVVPANRGWLNPLLRRLARDPALAAAGPKLLYADGAIQHAGMFFAPGPEGEWANGHFFKGWPRAHAPACRARRVPAVTGAALCVRRDAFEAAGGFCTDYILGDYEDSDLCLKLRAHGWEIAYEPAAELFHFERQSISTHPGHARTLAAAYNRRLHHERWSSQIAALMAGYQAR